MNMYAGVMKLLTATFVTIAGCFSFVSASAACDQIQLTAQFVGFYQYQNVDLCLKDHQEGSSERPRTGGQGQGCSKVFLSTNQARSEQIHSKVKAGDGYGLKEMFESWAFITKPDSEARKHFDACPGYGSYLNAATHAVSCFPYAGGPHVGLGSPAPQEAQAIGIKVCQ